MLKDITNSMSSPRYSGSIDSPSKSTKNKKFTFESRTIEDEINEINAIILRKNNPQNAYLDLSYRVFHLYENGAITSQKGGIDYLKKDEFILKPKISNIEQFKFTFPMFDPSTGLTYAVVNENDANISRAQMRELILRNNI